MKITFLGSGSAFVPSSENYNSNLFIESDDGQHNLLVDAGFTINDALLNCNIDVNNIQSIWISHNHGDHTSGLEYIGFKRYFGTFPFGQNKPQIFGSLNILTTLWSETLCGSMKYTNEKKMSLQDYFDINVTNLCDGKRFNIGGMTFQETKQYHVPDMDAFGLYMNSESGNLIYFSGDTQFDAHTISTLSPICEIIFHECEFAEYPNSVHTQFIELCALPEEVKKKIWLYHYSLNGRHLWEAEVEVLNAGFAGIVRRGQEFHV